MSLQYVLYIAELVLFYSLSEGYLMFWHDEFGNIINRLRTIMLKWMQKCNLTLVRG